MNRGNRREDIFITDTERRIFVDALADSCETFSVNLIAFVLMANHFHLLIQTTHGNLSEFMRHFLVTYTVRFNRRQQQREIPSLRKLQHDISAEQIIAEVAWTREVQTEDLLDRKTRLKELRQMTMELSYRYSNVKQAEIGAVFGVDYGTVSQSRARLKAKLESSPKLNKHFNQIKEKVINLSISKI